MNKLILIIFLGLIIWFTNRPEPVPEPLEIPVEQPQLGGRTSEAPAGEEIMLSL